MAAATAHAAGVNLAWDPCYGDALPLVRKLFACDRNSGLKAVVASFVPAINHPNSSLLEIQFDIQTRSGGTLPVWSDFATSSRCRRNLISIDGSPPEPVVVCQKTSASTVPLFIILRDNFQFRTPDHMVLVASANAGSQPLVAGGKYLARRLLISHACTVLAGACRGCLEPVAISLSQLRVSGGAPETLSTPAGGNVVAWQQELPVAARNTTWAAVKSLYR